MPRRAVGDADYARLLAIRTRLRRFERWSADQAAEHGLTSAQHQLLLAVRGHSDPQGPTIGQVADYLLVKHHSAVELADRTERAGLIRRVKDADDHRAVRLRLTAAGTRTLEVVTGVHIDELAEVGALVESMLSELRKR